MAHLRRVITARWGYGAADEFFAKQLPHNVTWLLTLLFALEANGGRVVAGCEGGRPVGAPCIVE